MWKLIRVAAATVVAIGAVQACKPRERIVPTLRDAPENVIGDPFVGDTRQAGSRQAAKELADRGTARALTSILYDRNLDRRLRAVDKNIALVIADTQRAHPGGETEYATVLSDLKARRAQVQQEVNALRAYAGAGEKTMKDDLERRLSSLEKDAAEAAEGIRTPAGAA